MRRTTATAAAVLGHQNHWNDAIAFFSAIPDLGLTITGPLFDGLWN